MNKTTENRGAESEYTMLSLSEILDTQYEATRQIVEGFIGSGLYILAGQPKIGKSFFVTQLAFHVATGTPLFGLKVYTGDVLYFALEDTEARIQERFVRMYGCDTDGDVGDRIFFQTQSRTVADGLLEKLEDFVAAHPETALVVVDPLQLVRGTDERYCSYASDYDFMSKLKHFGDTHNIGILAVHHTRKKETADEFLRISGTTGLLGAVDGALVLTKSRRTDNLAVLEYAGRDFPDQRLTLEFDRKCLHWHLKEFEKELWKLPPDPIVEAIDAFLGSTNAEWTGTATELLYAANLDATQIQPNTLTRKLNAAVGQMRDEYHIEYSSKRGHERRICLRRLPD